MASPTEILVQLLASPQVASKRWVYRQFDHMVQTNTLVLAGMGAGVVRVKGTNRALAFSVDGNGRYCYLDPFEGGKLAVAESARNVACAGALPIGATNCLNFGNPERPESMWQFVRAVEGISEACTELDIPITGGNVSLYNETGGESIHPTPVLGVVGIIEDLNCVLGRSFRSADSVVILLGKMGSDLGGSEYLKVIHGIVRGDPPYLNLTSERALQQLLIEMISAGLLESAHDCAEGGFAVTLAECCFDSNLGVDVVVSGQTIKGHEDLGLVATLFGETASRVIVSLAEKNVDSVLAKATAAGIQACPIGKTGGTHFRVTVANSLVIDLPLTDIERIWATGLSKHFEA